MTHKRWYDGTKAQIGIAVALGSIIATAFLGGLTLNTWITEVSATPQRLSEHVKSTRDWQIGHEGVHGRLERRLDILTEIQVCGMRTRTPEEADRCLSQSTRRQLEQTLRRNED